MYSHTGASSFEPYVKKVLKKDMKVVLKQVSKKELKKEIVVIKVAVIAALNQT